MVAAYLPDWADAALCTARPALAPMFSHSIPAALVLALVAAALTFMLAHDARAAWIAAGLVLSHVLLDYFTGIKPTWPNGPSIGLGLYRNPALDLLMEWTVLVAGWLLYRRTIPLSGKRTAAIMLAALLMLQAGIDVAKMLLPSVSKC